MNKTIKDSPVTKQNRRRRISSQVKFEIAREKAKQAMEQIEKAQEWLHL